MHRRSAADAAFGVFVRRQIRDVFLIWIRILRFAHFSWVPGFVLPGCTAELNRRALANWLLVPLAFRWQGGAAFGVFGRLQVTHINLRFVFLFFAHITFLSCFFGFGLCQSRRNICRPRRPSRLGSGRLNGSAYLWNASAVELHAPRNLRPFFPSTNSHAPYHHYPCHVILAFKFFRNLQFLIDI